MGKEIDHKIFKILELAALAPSTHNSQPWRVRIKSNLCEIYYDRTLNIPYADPENRDLFISIGCFIENLVLAANYYNCFKSLEYKFEEDLVAIVEFKDLNQSEINSNYTYLVDAIKRRVNTRGIFLNEPVPIDLPELLSNKVSSYSSDFEISFLNDKEDIKKLAHLTGEGLRMAYKNSNFRKEMASWFRNSFTRKREGLPGYALGMPALLSLIFPYIVRYFDVGKKLSYLNEVSIKSAKMACVVSAYQSDKKLTWVRTGRLVERLMLEVNSMGLSTSIFVASIEMGQLYKDVQKLINTERRPQFIFLIGRSDKKQRHTPRHPIARKIII